MIAAPFQISDLKQIVSGEIASPEIDLVNSKIKNQSLLTYIYNLNLSNVSIYVKSSTLEERRDLFLSYLNHKTVVNINGFAETYIRFLLNLKDITDLDSDSLEIIEENSLFSADEVVELMNSDTELRDCIEKAAFLLDGIIIHFVLNTNDINLTLDEEFGKIGVVNDPNWVGHTWINLLSHPVFNLYYYSKMPPMSELVYFPYQYSESIYKGKPLFEFLSGMTSVPALMQMTIDSLKEPQL